MFKSDNLLNKKFLKRVDVKLFFYEPVKGVQCNPIVVLAVCENGNCNHTPAARTRIEKNVVFDGLK